MNIFDMMFGEEPAAGQAITLLDQDGHRFSRGKWLEVASENSKGLGPSTLTV